MISDPDVVGLLYLVTIVCFVVALKFLSSPRHARKGNWIGGAGMLVAIGTTLAIDGIGNWPLLVVGMVIGSVVGVVGARTVRMTAMPQMVAIFNGVGGGAAALVALAEWHIRADPVWDETTSIVLSALIGSISFAGSVVAFAKLQELVSGRPIVFPGQNVVNLAILGGAAALGASAIAGYHEQWVLYAVIGLALLFGVLFVLPIGGADMPVVISLLNAFTGLAASATGFVLDFDRPDRVRDARRCRGNAADPPHGESDEPLGRQRPVRGLWQGAGKHRRRSDRRRAHGSRDDGR